MDSNRFSVKPKFTSGFGSAAPSGVPNIQQSRRFGKSGFANNNDDEPEEESKEVVEQNGLASFRAPTKKEEPASKESEGLAAKMFATQKESEGFAQKMFANQPKENSQANDSGENQNNPKRKESETDLKDSYDCSLCDENYGLKERAHSRQIYLAFQPGKGKSSNISLPTFTISDDLLSQRNKRKLPNELKSHIGLTV